MGRSRASARADIPFEDMLSAVDNRVYEAAVEDAGPPWRVLYIGPDRAGELVEVIVIERDDGTELPIHARTMHPGYAALISTEQFNG